MLPPHSTGAKINLISFGSLAVVAQESLRPMALRRRLSAGLPLSGDSPSFQKNGDREHLRRRSSVASSGVFHSQSGRLRCKRRNHVHKMREGGYAAIRGALVAFRRSANLVSAVDLTGLAAFGSGVVVGALADATLLHVLAKVLGGFLRAALS